MTDLNFDSAFQALTGNAPFPWQRKLYERFVAGDFPASCNLPTGLGKTAAISVWLIALAAAPQNVPRRLVYVVNRRTVVDQATREAEKIRSNLHEAAGLAAALGTLSASVTEQPLAISTLRGQFADNGEWCADPSRPAIIVGTVDMIGSRLLFGGYGCGFKSRPLHAGFLGQDVLLVHDEAHLEPAFQELLTAITREQARCREFGTFRVMELTATSRAAGEQFGLTADDKNDQTVQKRIRAKKRIVLHPVEDEKATADRVAELALAHKDSGQAILVFLRKLEDVEKAAVKLGKAKQKVERLTGTLRGFERDRLATENEVFLRFLPASHAARSTDGTVYLVCTSAGEVGVNISSDHLVCDLSPFDSMAQRFGRVNRFGDGDARLDVVHPTSFDQEKDYEVRRQKTLELLRSLDGDACPARLGEVPAIDRQTAFTPTPEILPTSDILFDAWAMTTVREQLPGRPPVADWLHGVSEGDPPETVVAWREEVELLTPQFREDEDRRPFERLAADLIEDYPLKPHELLRNQTFRVAEKLEMMADRQPDLPVWLVRDGEIEVVTFRELVAKDRQRRPLVSLADRTVLLPPSAGGMTGGFLDGSEYVFDAEYDIADRWLDENSRPRRQRVWNDAAPPGMRLVRTVVVGADEDDQRLWRWYCRPRSADDEGREWSSAIEQRLDVHLNAAAGYAERMIEALQIEEPMRSAVIVATRDHDLGKHRQLWQTAIGNRDYPNKVLAKSGNRRPPGDLSHYRHEFGSLLDIQAPSRVLAFKALPPAVQDLVLHLIAAHHGRARPHFPEGEVFDPAHQDALAAATACEVPRRFARLQRQYGRWGLAYLESLVRAADILASSDGATK